MIISDDQARAAAQALREAPVDRCIGSCVVSEDVLAQARTIAAGAPDLRADRVLEAQGRLLHGVPDSYDVASKILSRIVSDSL